MPIDIGDGAADLVKMLTAIAGKTANAGSYDRTTDSNEAIRDNLKPTLKKNTAVANYTFIMIDATTGNPATGLTVTAQKSLDGGAFSAMANSVSEIANGAYKINIAAADVNGDTGCFRFTATGAEATLITFITES